MEGMGEERASSNIDGDWESICRLLSMDQDPDFTNLLGHTYYDDHNVNEGVASLLMAGDPILELGTPNFVSQLSCSSDDQISPFSSSLDFHAVDEDDFLVNEAILTINDPMENVDELEVRASAGHDQVPEPKKRVRARASKDGLKRKGRAKKSRSQQDEEEEEEERSNSKESDHDSQEGMDDGSTKDAPTLNIDKKRAGRGAATDPQSLYARRRRERINERLRVLQTLVPNGTKVDISTMLEEAVHYVKFLQVQIKLLSSDEMWMYAPLAYNGFDVGPYNNFSPHLLA